MALFSKKTNDMNSLDTVPPPAGMPPPDMNPPQDMGQMQDSNAGGQDYYNQQQPAGPYGEQQPDQNMADTGMPPPPSTQEGGMPQDVPDMGQISPPDQGMGFQAQPSFPKPQFDQQMPMDDTKERVEEIAEAIIDEKWNSLIKDINKVIEWKERSDGEIKRLGQEIINLKERFEALHKGILGKITEYDQNLTNVGSEIKAMDMVFKKILPSFTENVNKLDRFVKGNVPNSDNK